ncbi:S8 family serine peptidase [Sphingomonas sp. KRR8]|uniref:S8 family serine peptidase n=1 Tax=Sphingomonas sp. KRR8 TaxID=2942996 RepID=UPI002021F491|nr:S8 family serine peptidase [Sphingomonas sp. KRR8]URD60765.1 S8 family serine peptidase [Sphingomonas sp. KRR8]
MSRRSSGIAALLLAGAALVAGTAARSQLLPSLPLGNLPLPSAAQNVPIVGDLLSTLSPAQRSAATVPNLDRLGVGQDVSQLAQTSLADLRRLRLTELIRSNPTQLESGPNGVPVRRGVLIAIDPTDAQLRAAAAAGFQIEARNDLGGLVSVTLRAPGRLSPKAAMRRLLEAAPGLAADYDHVYEPAGGALLPAMAAALAGANPPPVPAGRTIVMIDGGVASHPSLAGASIVQQGFAGAAKSTGHGTAVASLLVGRDGAFRGAADGARLYVADVYGGNPAAGSATAIVRALAWAASKRPDAISISLVGPSNLLLQRAVAILSARGIRMTAAVGNDGPAAPIQYPAAYPGVIAVTAVDARDRALPEAGRAARLDFAAPGADMAAALPGRGYAQVRGTSFATPLVAARLAATGSPQALDREAARGSGKVGRGIVCRTCRTDPKVVGAK